MQKRDSNKYYFSVEGETEKWYLNWLSNEINNSSDAEYKVKFVFEKEKNPKKFVKRVTCSYPRPFYHIFDYESDDEEHVLNFRNTIDNLNEASKLKPGITYQMVGYSNFTFELWMILHKSDCDSPLTDRSQYLQKINRAYGKNFETLDHYKTKNNFENILEILTLQDVKMAIQRAEKIMKKNREFGYQFVNYKRYKYYRENPSLSIWEPFQLIFSDCKLL